MIFKDENQQKAGKRLGIFVHDTGQNKKKKHEKKSVNIFVSISLNICFACSKELSN